MEQVIVDGRTKRGLANKQSILKAAKEIFLTKGYLDSTIMDITKRAGVGCGTPYTHFKGKDDILWNLFEEVADEFSQTFYKPFKPVSIQELETRQALEIRHVMELAVRHRPILQITYQAMGLSEMIKQQLDELFEKYIEKTIDDINYSRRKGFYRADLAPQITAKTIVYMIRELFWDVVFEKENNIEAISRVLTTLYLHGAINTPRAENG